MLVRSSKFILHMLAASLIGFVLLCGFAVWQLSRGPISVSFLTPYVEQALNIENAPVRVRLGDTVLTWAGLDRSLDVRAVGLGVISDDGILLASVPEISVRFSARALLNGLVAPTSLELLGPRVRIVRDKAGEIALDMAGNGNAAEGPDTALGSDGLATLLDELIARPDRTRETGYLTRIGITSALVEYEDLGSGLRLTAPRVSLALERDVEGIRASGSVALDVAGRPLRFQVSGVRSARSGNVDLGLTFSEIEPAVLVPLVPEFAFLNDLGMPLNGTVALSLDRNFALEDLGFDLDSEGGEIEMPKLYPEPRRIADVAVRGRARDGFRAIVIEEVSATLDGVPVTGSGAMVRRGRRINADFDAALRGIAVNDVGRWWPEGFNENARTWITQNLRDGTIQSANVSITGNMLLDDPGAFTVTDADGRIDATGIAVHYLRPMDAVRGVNAVATFDLAGFAIDVTAGKLRRMGVENGRILISGLDGSARGEFINIDLMIAGEARGALELLDQKPLDFVRRVDIDPAQASGSHRTQLIVQFPLIASLDFEDIGVAAASTLTGFGLAQGPLGQSIGDGNLSMQVDTEKMIVDGNLTLSGVPAGIAWTEWFSSDAATRRTYQVRAILNDAARAKLGADVSPWVTGPVGVGVTYTESRIGVVTGAAEIDLSSAAMAVDDLQWRKSAGIPGRAFVRFSGDRETIRRLDRFSVSAADLVADGQATLRHAADGIEPASLTFKRLAFGATDVFATAQFGESGGVDVTLGGRQIDARHEVAAFGEGGDRKKANSSTRAVVIRIAKDAPVGTVRLGEQTILTDLWGTVRFRGDEVREAALLGDLNRKGQVSVTMEDREDTRNLRLISENGGELVRALDVTDTILGGTLVLQGGIDDNVAPTTFVGQVDLTDFHLTETSSVARALRLASFSGLSDTAEGRGLALRRAEIPVTFTPNEIVITDAKLRGSDIGVLATGRIDRRTETIDLAGEVAPAYTLNSLLGNIPLIGTLLTGGGDGVFAASYKVSGPVSEPDVSVNPLTVLTPGIIRRLLTGFGNDNQAAPAQKPETGTEPLGNEQLQAQ